MVYFEDFDKYYIIYPNGKLWSKRRNMYLTPTIDKDGYLRHQLSDGNKKRYQCKVHRMVALAHLGGGHTTETINHKDGNRQNNDISNLEWMTRSENTTEAWARDAYKYRDHSTTMKKLWADGVYSSRKSK